jgi:hypothetical protein
MSIQTRTQYTHPNHHCAHIQFTAPKEGFFTIKREMYLYMRMFKYDNSHRAHQFLDSLALGTCIRLFMTHRGKPLFITMVLETSEFTLACFSFVVRVVEINEDNCLDLNSCLLPKAASPVICVTTLMTTENFLRKATQLSDQEVNRFFEINFMEY